MKLIFCLNNQSLPKLQPISEGYYAVLQGTVPKTLVNFHDAKQPPLWREYFLPFAVVVMSKMQDEFILIRDHLGIAPLYYCRDADCLYVGDTINAILKSLPQKPSFHHDQIEELFSDEKKYSDQTIYNNVHRVEPGYFVRFVADDTEQKIAYWRLEAEGEPLIYSNANDYLEHFTALMQEAMLNATHQHQNIAAEFSAGLDSSAIFCTANNLELNPTLYMHAAYPESEHAQVYNDRFEKEFIKRYPSVDIRYIIANDFEPLKVFKTYAKWFSGPAPYLFFMFANPIHQAVSTGKHPILLSGFGGDQASSGQVPANFYMYELVHNQGLRKAYQDRLQQQTSARSRLYAGLSLLKFAHPRLFQNSLTLKAFFSRDKMKVHPYNRRCFTTLREAIWSLLQGPDSHEVRMRIEYSSLVSKQMGFEYRYPLLYPKILEFILALPLAQQRHQGRGRYLMRRYLKQFLPSDIVEQYKKAEGLGIVPATMEVFNRDFQQYPVENHAYSHLIYHPQTSIMRRNFIKAQMLFYAEEITG